MNRFPIPRQSLASLLAAAVLALGVSGCTSVGLSVAAGPVPGAVAPSPEELEKIARTVARAFPE